MRLHPTNACACVLPAFREDNVVSGKLCERLGRGIDEVITFSVRLMRDPHRCGLRDLAHATPRILSKMGSQVLRAQRLLPEDEVLFPLMRLEPGEVLQQDRVVWIGRLRRPVHFWLC